MKKETRNLFIGIILGVLTSLAAESIFAFRSDIVSWTQCNPIFWIVLVVATIISYLILKG